MKSSLSVLVARSSSVIGFPVASSDRSKHLKPEGCPQTPFVKTANKNTAAGFFDIHGAVLCEFILQAQTVNTIWPESHSCKSD